MVESELGKRAGFQQPSKAPYWCSVRALLCHPRGGIKEYVFSTLLLLFNCCCFVLLCSSLSPPPPILDGLQELLTVLDVPPKVDPGFWAMFLTKVT